jgi:alkylation response protein AidB-like acyl-CoA dehydrogenase
MAEAGSSELETFRAEAREWLEANYPASLRKNPEAVTAAAGEGGPSQNEDVKLWTKRIGEKGWGCPTWPKQYGGGGLSQAQARALQQEMARIGARNPITGMGPGMFGHTLLEYGTEEQKKRHLIPICRGELRWCQGYSEPGSGSDLASLITKCEDKGDHYEINGQKIWTSGAQFADWCFCLVRTDTTKKHEGISFVLINMRQPGVLVRPILMISGASGQCETFFTNARAEKNDLVGELNHGWTIAKRLLQHERSGQGGGGGMAGAGASVPDLAKRYVGADGAGRIVDTDLRSRVTEHMMAARAHSLTIQRAMAEAKGNLNPSATTSIMKNSGMKVAQDRAELTLEVMGHQGLGWEGEGFSADELSVVRGWLGGKAGSIYGGSNEIQNNIISKRILGLPDPTNST